MVGWAGLEQPHMVIFTGWTATKNSLDEIPDDWQPHVDVGRTYLRNGDPQPHSG